MMWHDKQNSVLFDLSISLEKPIVAQRTGRQNRMRKASILPPRDAVAPGRRHRTAIKTMHSRISKKSSVTDVAVTRDSQGLTKVINSTANRFAEDGPGFLSLFFLAERPEVSH